MFCICFLFFDRYLMLNHVLHLLPYSTLMLSQRDIQNYLLLNPLGIGPGHLLAWLAKGKLLTRAVCHRLSSRNCLAHSFETEEICAHSEWGTRTKISIRRWSGSFANGLSAVAIVLASASSVIRTLQNKHQKFQKFIIK